VKGREKGASYAALSLMYANHGAGNTLFGCQSGFRRMRAKAVVVLSGASAEIMNCATHHKLSPPSLHACDAFLDERLQRADLWCLHATVFAGEGNDCTL